MTEQVEVSSLDLRFQDYRLRHRYAEKQLLLSVMEHGFRDPLQGVSIKGNPILLDGFKRYRCAQKLHIAIVPYQCLCEDVAVGIIELLRLSNARSLTLLEQAKLIDELRSVHQLSPAEIARQLEKSKAWVSVRLGVLAEMPPLVVEKIMSGAFPAYCYLYTLRPFRRLNSAGAEEVSAFVESVAGKGLSTRDIETLAHGFFKGSESMRQQITQGNIPWALNRLKHSDSITPGCHPHEQAWLRDLEVVQKTLCRLISRSQDDKAASSAAFRAQAHLLSGGILRQLSVFKKTVEALHDQCRQMSGDLPAA